MKRAKMLTWKKVMVPVLALSIAFIGLAGCGKTAEKPAQAPSLSSAAKETPKTPDKKYVVKYGHVSPPNSLTDNFGKAFKKNVEEISKGQIELQIFPSAQLGDKIPTMEGMRAGSIEMSDVAATDLSNFTKMFSAFALPYIFNDMDHVFRVLGDKDVSDKLNKEAEASGFKIIFWGHMGERSIINSKKAVNKPEDLKGIKLRVMQDPLLAKVIGAMGAAPTPMAWSEVYAALQQKTIDGFENSPSLIADNKMYEVAKFYSLTEQFIIPDPQLMSLKFFNGLPKDLQDAVMQAGKKTEEDCKKISKEFNEKAVKTLIDNGVQINKPDKAAFAAAVQPVIDNTLTSGDAKAKELYEAMKKIK